jgi:TolB-like protein/class 3 adenylate cyclase
VHGTRAIGGAVPREQRRLAAIISADVVGYSRLMGRDESGTVARLRAMRKQHFEPVIARHKGRVVKLTGDGALMEFASAVEAMAAAVEFQQAIARANQDVPANDALVFRVGLHLGDVIVDGDDLYGDGVNIAARLEGEAPPGGIVVSGTVQEFVDGRLKVTFHDLGELSLKNIERPVRAMGVTWNAADWPVKSDAPAALQEPASATPAEGALPLPDKPSIAVLPFANMSGNPEQEYFADGITEDITTALSRISSLFVIARNSSFAYKGKAIDVRQIGRELGVRYVLEGSVRKAGQRLRITGQLIDAETGSHLWVDRFDSVLEDVFDLQDRVTMAVAGAMEPSITQAEIRRANRKPTENLQAYDWLLRALGEQPMYSRDSFDGAIGMARRAIEVDPRYAQAYAYLANWITFRKITNDWMKDEAAEMAEGVRFAHLAVQLAPNDSIVLAMAAEALGRNRDLANASPWLDRAIALNPNSAVAFGRGAIVRTFAGDYATAIDHADRAMRLSPFDPLSFVFSLARGIGHLLQRQVPEAVSWLGKSAQQNPRNASAFLWLGSALAHAGQMEEARTAIRRLLELRPMSSVTWHRQHCLHPEGDYEYLLEGARLAGLPE